MLILQNIVLLLYVVHIYHLPLSCKTSLIASQMAAHIQFVSAVVVSDCCNTRIKEFRNHTETVKYIKWNLMSQLYCIEEVCCRRKIISEIMSLWSASFLVSTCLWNLAYDKMCASSIGVWLVKFWSGSQGHVHRGCCWLVDEQNRLPCTCNLTYRIGP